MDRPTIFLSSTVYDFGDLRSALKDYLELRGCRVLASEFTDFTRPLDEHSYKACLDTIEQADIFVLFIGRRVGGFQDETKRVSITRAEYRHAYNLAKTFQIKLLCFVRSDVLNHYRCVQDLAKLLRDDPALTEAQRHKFANCPTQAMDSAEDIRAFIDEVTRNRETRLASQGKGEAPIANWIWPFTTFTEIRQALDPLVAHGRTVQQAAGRKALEVQLAQILRAIVPIVKYEPFNPFNTVVNIRNELNLRTEPPEDEIGLDGEYEVTISEKRWGTLGMLMIFAGKSKIDPTPLVNALSSELLLQYDPATGAYIETDEYSLLAHVVQQARLFASTENPHWGDINMHLGPVLNANKCQVPAYLVSGWIFRLLRWVDLIGSTRALAASLSGSPLILPPHIPFSPYLDQEEGIAADSPTPDQIQNYIATWPNETV